MLACQHLAVQRQLPAIYNSHTIFKANVLIPTYMYTGVYHDLAVSTLGSEYFSTQYVRITKSLYRGNFTHSRNPYATS